MKITYNGPVDGVEVPVGEGRKTVAHGESIDLPAKVADSLLATGDWNKTLAKSQDDTPAKSQEKEKDK